MSVDMQALIDGMSARWQKERAASQMTLGKMIAALEAMPADATIDGLSEPHSYRGYYSDLAFERTGERMPVADVLAMCRAAMGQVFEGYKGGDFVMGALTPLWLASYGSCGQKIMEVTEGGDFVTADDD